MKTFSMFLQHGGSPRRYPLGGARASRPENAFLILKTEATVENGHPRLMLNGRPLPHQASWRFISATITPKGFQGPR